jgi:hypothetical protein
VPRGRRKLFRSVVSRLKAFASYIDAFTSWGTKWKVTSGTWTTSSGKSKTSTSANSYPLAAVQMSKKDVTATVASPQPGAGISLWVTDSGNWWGVVREQTVNNSYNCSTCTASFTNPYANATGYGNATNPSTTTYANASNPGTTTYANASNPGTTSWNPSSFFYLSINNQKFYNPPTSKFTPGNPFTNSSTTPGNPFTFSFPFTTGGNTSYFTFSCNCSSSYPQSIKLIKSVAGTVSTVTSWSVGSATDVINAIKVITSGNDITIRPYSNTAATTQIGSDLTHTATGATTTANFGIIVGPSTNSQGDGTGTLTVTSS